MAHLLPDWPFHLGPPRPQSVYYMRELNGPISHSLTSSDWTPKASPSPRTLAWTRFQRWNHSLKPHKGQFDVFAKLPPELQAHVGTFLVQDLDVANGLRPFTISDYDEAIEDSLHSWTASPEILRAGLRALRRTLIDIPFETTVFDILAYMYRFDYYSRTSAFYIPTQPHYLFKTLSPGPGPHRLVTLAQPQDPWWPRTTDTPHSNDKRRGGFGMEALAVNHAHALRHLRLRIWVPCKHVYIGTKQPHPAICMHPFLQGPNPFCTPRNPSEWLDDLQDMANHGYTNLDSLTLILEYNEKPEDVTTRNPCDPYPRSMEWITNHVYQHASTCIPPAAKVTIRLEYMDDDPESVLKAAYPPFEFDPFTKEQYEARFSFL